MTSMKEMEAVYDIPDNPEKDNLHMLKPGFPGITETVFLFQLEQES